MIPIYRKRTIFDPSGCDFSTALTLAGRLTHARSRRETQISTTYYVVDSVDELAKFGADAWDRVVCVMTTGQPWQFKPYKWNEPRALFHHGAPPHFYVCVAPALMEGT
jgi:parafibromin